jgi:hypothetical protein
MLMVAFLLSDTIHGVQISVLGRLGLIYRVSDRIRNMRVTEALSDLDSAYSIILLRNTVA